jgi:2-oxoglutarate dehydrogenase E2 component (dihydrolipoamide succinyltransferase)
MAIDVPVPELGESVKTAVLLKWHKSDGDAVRMDEPICELETDKANVDIPAPAAGVLKRLKKEGETVNVGEPVARLDTAGGAAATSTKQSSQVSQRDQPKKPAEEKSAPAPKPPAKTLAKSETPVTPAPAVPLPPLPEPAKRAVAAKEQPTETPKIPSPSGAAAEPIQFDENGIYRAPMSKIRKRIAQTLVQAQQTAAILTTFNEIDLSTIVELRSRYKDKFQETYGVGLGYMSFFARATALALKEFPRVNAFIDGDDVVYHQFVHLGIAVSTERGLAVPVLRNAEKMSFAKIESEIKRLAAATREGKLQLHELAGGTFTITNGGIFGSLLSTPILNPPQSGILGMHTIQKRPVVINDKIEIRSMMYVALSYDHRLVDGRESVSFLVRLKQYLEDPARLMLEI